MSGFLKRCLQSAMEPGGFIQTSKIGQNANPAVPSGRINDNGALCPEIDFYVYFNADYPASTYLKMDKLKGFSGFYEGIPEFEYGPAGNLQIKVNVWVLSRYVPEFTSGVRNLPGFIGIELTEHCDAVEAKLYDHYCTPALIAR